MIDIWDEQFKSFNDNINPLENPDTAFNLMHNELRKVYKNCFRVLKPGGILIINIGDAVRTIKGLFKKYSNAARTVEICEKIGFHSLPQIFWHKPTNSPNKFLGSGMLPGNAYVSLEVEHILIFRKGNIRKFTNSESKIRKESAFFYKERNMWFQPVWNNINGVRQSITNLYRARTAAFPLMLPLRLIWMYSIKGDWIWDPFGGTGTTTMAAMLANRNSILNDIDSSFINYTKQRLKKKNLIKYNKYLENRYKENLVNEDSLYKHKIIGSVKTKQEMKIDIDFIDNIEEKENKFFVTYKGANNEK